MTGTGATDRFAGLAGREGFQFRAGPITVNIRSRAPQLAAYFRTHYAEYPVVPRDAFIDYNVEIVPPNPIRRFVRKNAWFTFDGITPFLPAPLHHAPPVFEWGLNWTITSTFHTHLVIHSAVVEKGGRALLLPAPPGAGKSTLCAALANRGWRLLSDELAIIDFDDLSILGVARPVNLKNDSIEVMRRFAPEAVFSAVTEDTSKGRIALMKAPSDAIARVDEPARPAWIVFPKYQPGHPSVLEPASKASACLELGDSAFNYSIHGRRGFEALSEVIDRCDTYRFTYSDLDDAIARFDALAEDKAG